MIATVTDMKAFLPSIVMKGTPNVFDDALKVAQQQLEDKILGSALMDAIDVDTTSYPELKEKCQRIVCVDAFLSAIHEMDLVLTDSGFAVIQDEQMAPASKDRVANLKASLQDRLDLSRDLLISWLTDPAQGSLAWGGTEQFKRLTSGLFLTFSQFKEVAVYNNVTANAYPRTWSDYCKLIGTLSVVLMTNAASYISTEYASELLEKVRDAEQMDDVEMTVLRLIRTAIAALVLTDAETYQQQITKAVAVMKANPEKFPTYMHSKAASAPGINHSDTPIFSMF